MTRVAAAVIALLFSVPVHAQEAPLSAADCARLAASLRLPSWSPRMTSTIPKARQSPMSGRRRAPCCDKRVPTATHSS